MEILVFVAAFIVLAALADRFGVDNRDNLRSPDAEFVALGFVRELQEPIRRDPWTE
jgi:hypothetical protein